MKENKKSNKNIIKILVALLIIILCIIGVKVAIIKYQSSDSYIHYQDVTKVNQGLADYDGSCNLSQTNNFIDLLINKINTYGNDEARRINEIDVTYTKDSLTDSNLKIVYNGNVQEYIDELNNVKSTLDSITNVLVSFEYDDDGYVEKVNMQLHTSLSLRNMIHEHNSDNDLPEMTAEDIQKQIEQNNKLTSNNT